MERGYVRLYRKALDCGLIQDARVWQVLSWCLLKATHRRFRTFFNGRFVELAPGQLVTSREAACRELLLSVQEFRTALGKLVLAGALACEATSWGTIITIVNWHSYQHGLSEGQPGGPPGANRETTRPSTIIQEQKHTGYPDEAGAMEKRTGGAGSAEERRAGAAKERSGGEREAREACAGAGMRGEPGGREERGGGQGGAGSARREASEGRGGEGGLRRDGRTVRRVVAGRARSGGEGVPGGWNGVSAAREFEETELPPWAREAGL